MGFFSRIRKKKGWRGLSEIEIVFGFLIKEKERRRKTIDKEFDRRESVRERERKMEETTKKKKKIVNTEDSKKKERHIVTWTPEVSLSIYSFI